MTETSVDIATLISRMKVGDVAARDELFREASDQLERMARKRLNQDFRRLRLRGLETGDVLNDALVRVLERFKKEGGLDRIANERDFYVLVAQYIRWTLCNTATGFRHQLERLHDGPEVTAETVHPFSLAKMTDFHEEVEKLPAELREAFELRFYADLTNEEIAGQLGVSKDTVKRRFKEAKEVLKNVMPG
jgi:RNA polymerase sigma-70 factor (ECF subfamily)